MPKRSLYVILRDALAVAVHKAKHTLSAKIALIGRLAIPECRLRGPLKLLARLTAAPSLDALSEVSDEHFHPQMVLRFPLSACECTCPGKNLKGLLGKKNLSLPQHQH